MELVIGLLTIAIMIGAYLLPGIIASCRGHRQTLAIFMLTLLTGWTGFGWCVALVWACTADLKKKDS